MRKKNKPVVAIMYDFDKTLCTKDMQEYTFIPNVGLKPMDFWTECNLRRQAVVDALANGRFALKAAATVKQLCFGINQHGIVLRNSLRYSV